VADDFTRKGSRQGFARAVTSEFRQWLPWIALALLGLGPLVVCALIGPVEAESKLGQKAAPDWSRAIRIGGEMYGIDSGAPLVVGDDGRVHLIWTLRRTPQDYDVRYLRLDQEGLVQEEYDLGLPLYQPRRLRLMMGGDARMHVFLLAFVEQGAKSGLFHFTLTDDGRLNSGPDLLSSATDNCFEFDVAQTSTGTMQVFWTEGAGDRRNMFGLALAPEADAPDEPRMLAQGVAHPVAAGGPGDALYVMWEEPGVDDDTTDLYYMVVTDGYPESLSGQKLMDMRIWFGRWSTGGIRLHPSSQRGGTPVSLSTRHPTCQRERSTCLWRRTQSTYHMTRLSSTSILCPPVGTRRRGVSV
jgi:hypothetical protein